MFESEGNDPNPERQNTELHRAASEKVKHAISAILDRKIEQLVEHRVDSKDLEDAADQLFRIAAQGASTEDIDQRLAALSSKIVAKLLEPGA
jgi:hypothetical protein